MTLVLLVISLNEEPLSQPLVGRFDERGGTIGRSDGATFTLPDPERMISRTQAKILHADQDYWIENVSAASTILHNGRPLSAGMRVVLKEADELRIGDYGLQTSFEDDETSATILRGRSGSTQRQEPQVAPKVLPAKPAKPPTSAMAAMAAMAATPAGPVPAPPERALHNAPPASEEADRLWRALLAGLGADSRIPEAPSAELMQQIGQMLRIAVGGLHQLVEMRTIAKDEMQAQMTVVQVSENNPLKFAPDEIVALQLLLQPPARGFLDGPAALRDALIDLQSHQVGVMSGMRAALLQVFDRFDPAQLESRLSARSLLDALRPDHRRARLWDLYLEHYRSLRDEAQGDFQRLFGAAFRESYEAQIRRLASEPPGRQSLGSSGRGTDQ